MEKLDTIKVYDLVPTNGRKSFYGKAKVKQLVDGSEVMQSYETDILCRRDGYMYLLCEEGELTTTTCSHIKSFCGLNKKQVLALQRK
jgi:hypothetical protein